MKILIKNAVVVTCNDKNDIFLNGNIVVEEDKIIGVYNNLDQDEKSFDKVIDAKKMIAMPGLVNAHTHAAMTLLRNYGGGLGLEDWLQKKIFPAEAKLVSRDIYYGTMLAGIEMIRSGTTSFMDMYLFTDSICEAVDTLGLRANICDLPIDHLGGPAPVKALFEKWNNKGDRRIKPYVLVHSAYLYGEKELEKAAQIARELEIGIHTHLLETKKEFDEGILKYGINNTQEMKKCGIFDVPVTAAHCIHVTDEDVITLKEKEVNVVNNPTSNLKLGSGIAPVDKMVKSGINVCLGTDGSASNNNLDMFEEIKLAALLENGVNQDATLTSSEQVIKMATVNGSRALDLGYTIGSLQKCSKADIILIDTDKAHFTPLNDPQEAIVYCCKGSDVDTVIIDGQILMEKRILISIDEEKIMFEADKIAKRIII